ncbi:MAG: RIP metalloprotease RseP [Candidatus Kerfeldbacteria bacterium RIFOXYA2_FULL_38_24]|uniref:Zinc metalloprotease n=1 Tax=Candidatus Kerfeldbacteria bacterium RIFOXYB2_FULL_38_14 TaxID=1798547 RepID=A0A1G2BBF8_9BACT|nr:MAG: RIP metalloprotease RseP [Candidatus Kerfeldbacteria bacterium RIFOXYA2_FULL_38_24]OGY86036.1 MAG: RIP metalloprotease RseP [Candidatus Kerfeldbacteria bacterium RIFOXYB2_FULL_38_14]OGY90152.1 MAG: RIP metalloprotease RseP [Candidatus Kerfeldbacteria bacterium RIFOXYC2_FULL_38_9]
METLGTLAIFVVILGILVFIHELGHFLAAKRSGVAVDEFGFGFPPRIFGKKIGQTTYSLNWIPLGGFVKIKGVAGDDEKAEAHQADKNSFSTKPFWKKATILFAGIFMNLLLAVVLLSIVFSLGIPTDPSTVGNGAQVHAQQLQIVQIIPDGPAAQVGLQGGDVITEIAGENIKNIDNFQKTIAQDMAKNPLEISILRNDTDALNFTIIPQKIKQDGQEFFGIGVGLQEVAIVSYPWYLAIFQGLKTTGSMIALIFISLGGVLKNIIFSGQVSDDIAGPIGIAVLTGQVAKLGLIRLLQFTAILSINLAIFNLLPIPALDGGRIIFVILEKIRKKPVNQKTEALVHNIGFLFLLLLILLVTFKDIAHYNLFGFL